MTTELSPEMQQIVDNTFQKIHDIEALLLKNDPMLPGHLAEIHKHLINYEELVHLLSDEQISQLIKGQMQVTGTVVLGAAAKTSKASISKQAKGITVDDL